MYRRRRRRVARETKKINIDTSGKSKELLKMTNRNDSVPSECMYPSPMSNATVAFVGRFRFGVKDQLIKIAKAFKIPAITSFSNTTGFLVVDDKERVNSVTIKKARRDGVTIITEEEFLHLIASNKRRNEIKCEKV